jgi:Dolichyl-phosphate-mannose-protein mannosyltransferase
MKTSAMRGWDRETAGVAQLAACVSVLSFFYYFQHGQVLLYGDAVAHCNIARRVFDSRTPGLLQLGTVWLPLPHLLMIPFIVPIWMWQTGFGGSIPSLLAYVFAVTGIFRLVRGALGFPENRAARPAAWIATAVFAANPNLIYLQSTAMTESLYLAFFIWAIVYFAEFARTTGEGQSKSATNMLTRCGLCLGGACLTRYDGWFLAATIVGAVLLALAATRRVKTSGRRLTKFILLAGAAPVLWLAYNAAVYRNPLEFANGPYSAKAIEQKTALPGYPAHPGTEAPVTAASYFLKAAELNLAESNWNRLWLLVLLTGTGIVLIFERRLWPFLFLWAPLPFYTLSIAYGGVPIFIPPWWPFSIYNARYGVELLPAFAVFTGVASWFLLLRVQGRRAQLGTIAAVLALCAGSYASVWRSPPIAFREAWINSRTRIALERELAHDLELLPPNSTILMYLGDHGGALQRAGIPLRRVIYEGNHRTWIQPRDPDGLWERALADPAKYADYVVAVQGDAVSLGVNRSDLSALVVVHVMGQPPATIFAVKKNH